VNSGVTRATAWREVWRRTREHLALVAQSLIPAIVVAVPLGVLAAKRPRVGRVLLGAVGVVQTIPALALLVLLIAPLAYFQLPTVGAGSWTAVVALFLYSLLPIVQNTATGLAGIAPEYHESAAALGLSPRFRLWHIELPLASPAILAGVKTAAVLNVGFATLGALVGAGGYGQPILTGIRLNNTGLILQGAIPAAALALVLQAGFEIAERWFVPAGLRTGQGEARHE
jgi:osmoprotectant transport system permease protein